jgi:hypothetical protein
LTVVVDGDKKLESYFNPVKSASPRQQRINELNYVYNARAHFNDLKTRGEVFAAMGQESHR